MARTAVMTMSAAMSTVSIVRRRITTASPIGAGGSAAEGSCRWTL